MCHMPSLCAVRQPTAGEAPLSKLRQIPSRVALPAAAPPLPQLLAAPVRATLSCPGMAAAGFHPALAWACRHLPKVASAMQFIS